MKPNIVEQHNKELEQLYQKAKKDISAEVAEYNEKQQDKPYSATFPLFLKSYEHYENAEIKVMIFGQETNGWGDYDPDKTIVEIMNGYVEFFISEYCYKHYGGHFWNGINKIKRLLEEKNAGKSIGYLWNNAVKMGYNRNGFPHNFYGTIVKPHLNNLIVKEIEILKPDYIIFLTGYRYDGVLADIFGELKKDQVEGFPIDKLCEITIPNVKKSLRTYHPRPLYQNRYLKSSRGKIFNKIIEEITQDINLNYKR